ncbi:prolipoprotein diacylglyceryl transferase [Elusimicrobiota bacterium]
MRPILVNIPVPFTGIEVSFASYSTILAISFVIGIYLAARRWEKIGGDPQFMVITSIYGMVFTLAGAKIFYIAQNFHQYHLILHSQSIGDFLRIFKGGLVFYGGLIGGIGGTVIYLYRKRADILLFLDTIVGPMALGNFFVRIGCFLNGCCYGKPTTVPWGIRFPPGSNPEKYYSAAVHPAQLYESFFALALFGILMHMSGKAGPKGRIFLAYVFLYSVGRFMIEFFRGDAVRGVYGALSTSQWIGIVLALVSLYALIRLYPGAYARK